MEDDRFWEMVEDAWAASGFSTARRLELLHGASGRVAIAHEVEAACSAMVQSLRESLRALEEKDVLAFDRVLERKLQRLDRRDVHRVTDGSDDSFLYARGFILAAGRQYYEAVDSDPHTAVMGVECESIAYLAAEVMGERFGEDAWTRSEISRESFTNPEGWKS